MVEELLVNGALEIVNKLISIAGQEISLLWGFKYELKKLRTTLKTIWTYLEDAGNRHAKEFVYDTLRSKMETQYHTKNKVIDFFSLSNNQLAFRLKVAHRIQNVDDDGIKKDMKAFNLNKVDGGLRKSSSGSCTIVNHDTSSFIYVSHVFGRKNDVEEIKKMLLGTGSNTNRANDYDDDDDTVSVIPIVGIGGLGKTMIAQLLYNDTEVGNAFGLKKWVSISNYFGNSTLLKIVCDAICGSNADLSNKEEMQRSLEGKLKTEELNRRQSNKGMSEEEKRNEKKLLLVLDDMWSGQFPDGGNMNFQEQWDDLKLVLKCFVAGSRIIVITRSKRVVEIMGSSVSSYLLGLLSDDDCWSVFEKLALRRGGPEKSPAFGAIGREIAKMCGVVPLEDAKTLGGLMHSKKTLKEWLSIKNSELLNNASFGDNNHITVVLKLSYDHLSPPLKVCFSYCVVFPKSSQMEKKLLIQLWMAQGFLQSSSNYYDVENVGNDYFNTLCGSCFFQDIQLNGSGDIEMCKMHDLLHDLGCSTSYKECLVLDSTMIRANDISETYHLWVSNVDFDPKH